MRSINKVILIGNITRDPEMRKTPNGQSMTTFGLATNREWMNQGGDKKGLTEFHELVAWSKLAEICAQYLKKGKLIYVEGYLKTRSWDTPEGVRKFKTEVVIQDMIMLEKRSDNGEDMPVYDAAAEGDEGTEEKPTKEAPVEEEKSDDEKAEDTPDISIEEDLKL